MKTLRKRKTAPPEMEDQTEGRITPGEDDPEVPYAQWYLIFHELHVKLLHETKDFDYQLLKERNPGLYCQIKVAEAEIDGLGDAKLSEVMTLIRR